MAVKLNKCRDTDMNCATWIATNRSSCDAESGLVVEHCPRMCQTCGEVVEPSEKLVLLLNVYVTMKIATAFKDMTSVDCLPS
ncbi:shTK domain protein [Cooperia oncophora]